MPNAHLGDADQLDQTMCLLHGDLDILRRNDSPVAPIPFCPEARVVAHLISQPEEDIARFLKVEVFQV